MRIVFLVLLVGVIGSSVLFPSGTALDPAVRPDPGVTAEQAGGDPPDAEATVCLSGPEAASCGTAEDGLPSRSTRLAWRDRHEAGTGLAWTRPGAPLATAETPLPERPRNWLELGGIVLFLVWIGHRLLPLAAGARLERDEVRAHPVRRQMLEHLEAHPGATAVALAEAVGIGCGRALYHLAILEREQVVRARRLDRRRRFFPMGAPRIEDAEVAARDLARPERQTGRIVHILRHSPGTTLTELARLLGMSPGQTHYHVSKLDEVGVLYRVRRGRRVRHYLTTEGQALVSRVQRLMRPDVAGGEVSA